MRRVSYSTWHYCVSCRQETVREGFPIRLDAIVFQCGRKLFAKGFLLGLTTLCFLPTGNFLRRVSYSTWHYCVSCRQETVRKRFPIRLDAIVFQCDRKLFADSFLLGMALLCFLPTGNYLRMVSCATWHHCVSCRQETFSPGDFSTPLPTLEMTGAWQQWDFLRRSAVSRQRIADKADHKKAGPHGSAFCYSLFFRCLIPLSAMSWRYCTPCQWILETPL